MLIIIVFCVLSHYAQVSDLAAQGGPVRAVCDRDQQREQEGGRHGEALHWPLYSRGDRAGAPREQRARGTN